MKIMITGGAGFIGSHLSERFLREGHEVISYDNLMLGRKELIQNCLQNPRFRFVEADLLDLERLKEEMKGCALVYHMAANSDISQGAQCTDIDLKNGTLATYNVLESMRLLNVKEIVMASTSALYGEATVKPTPENYGPLFPVSFYGASKLACEGLVTAFSHNYGIKAWVYRFANIVGSHSTHGAIHDFVLRLINRPERLEVLGNGTQRKSYLHVQDCMEGMIYGHRHSQEIFQCFNLASQGVTNVKFIAEAVVEAMRPLTGIRAEIKYGEADRGWRGDVPYTHLDGSLLERLGWQARHQSDEAVRLAISEIAAEKWKARERSRETSGAQS